MPCHISLLKTTITRCKNWPQYFIVYTVLRLLPFFLLLIISYDILLSDFEYKENFCKCYEDTLVVWPSRIKRDRQGGDCAIGVPRNATTTARIAAIFAFAVLVDRP